MTFVELGISKNFHSRAVNMPIYSKMLEPERFRVFLFLFMFCVFERV